MLQFWFELKDEHGNAISCPKKTLFYGTIKNKTIFFRSWFDKGVSTLEKPHDPNLNFFTFEDFVSRYQLQINFVTYYGVINAIPKEYKIAIERNQCTASASHTTMGELKSPNSESHI